MPNCKKCGASYGESFNFCPYCGRDNSKESDKNAINILLCSCGHQNPITLQYCQKCGKRIVQKCKQCGTLQDLMFEYCGNCGIRLSEAKYTLPGEITHYWWERFCDHPGFREVCDDNGYANTTLHTYARNVFKSWHPNFETRGYLGNAVMPFWLPITKLNWGIDTVKLQNQDILYGDFWAEPSQITIIDYNKNSENNLFYEDLLEVGQTGDWLKLSFSKGVALQLHFQIPRPARDNSGLIVAGQVGSSLLGGIFSAIFDLDKNPVERKLDDIHREIRKSNQSGDMTLAEKAAYDYQTKIRSAESYVLMFKSFFEDVIKRRN